MQDSKTITRRKAADKPDSFVSLRKEGIRFTQEFSGDIWTDYNAHDPGITILEQLCYGLTDLIYRAGFKVEDYLVDQNGQLNFDSLGLASAEQIMPCRPSTLADYRAVLLDQVDEIERLWIRPISNNVNHYKGLYVIDIQLNDEVRKRCLTRPVLKDRVIEKVIRIYAKLRNLGEDLVEVNVLNEQGYCLHADIDIESEGYADDILAEIYFTTDQWLKGYGSGAGGVKSYEDHLNEGKTLDQIFNGPITLYGQVQEEQPTAQTHKDESHISEGKPLSDLYARLMAIKAITRINALQLGEVIDHHTSNQVGNSHVNSQSVSNDVGIAGDNIETTHIDKISAHAWFSLPQEQQDILVVLKRNGHAVKVDSSHINTRFEQRIFKQNTLRYTRQETASLYHLPQANYRQLAQYHSIQNHFPIAYNLKVQGISQSIKEQDFAKVQQLKGYLLIFEQLMANFTANLSGIRQLFSVDISQEQSYQMQLISQKTLTGIDQIYPESAQAKFTELLAKYDPYFNRKSRVFDYLLALYGETYQPKCLSQYNYYHHVNKFSSVLLEYKYNYLKSVVQQGKDRGGAFDYGRLSTGKNNLGGFHTRIAFHLGMNESRHWPYTDSLCRLPLAIVNDDDYQVKEVYLNESKQEELISVSLAPEKIALSDKKMKTILDSLRPLKGGVIGQSLFNKGLNINCYKILPNNATSTYEIIFQSDEVNAADQNQPWLKIGQVSSLEKAMYFVNLLSSVIAKLNRISEGIHVVEHILLRPTAKEPAVLSDDNDIFSFQISVVLPAYTARCADPAFRVQAETVIRENCPAHILPTCYWFDFDAMCEFEKRHLNWLAQRHACISRNNACLKAGEQLMDFLQTYKRNVSV